MLFDLYLYLEMPMQTGDNLALAKLDPTLGSGPGELFVLFDSNSMMRQALKSGDSDEAKNHIYGIMKVRDNTLYDAHEVDSVWARPGYGPLMYLIAMKGSGPRGLMSSRVSDQVTPAAKNVWQNFHSGSGRKFVTHQPLAAQHHEEDYLNRKYVLKAPLNINGMLSRGKVNGVSKNTLDEAAEILLSDKMGEIY